MDFIGHFGLPKFISSDSGVQFISTLWKKLEDTLAIKLNRGPLYRPQAVGMVERNHQTFKNSLKAQILDFANKNQKKWPQLLNWALLSIRASFRNDIDASPSELAHGFKPVIPGSLILDINPSQNLQEMLSNVKNKTNKPAVQTKINVPNPVVPEPPDDATHVYTREHKRYGLDPGFKGPFPIVKRLTRSSVRIEVGRYADNSVRTEDRHWSDLKAIKLDQSIKPETRPKLGRPSKELPSSSTGPPTQKPFTGFQPNEIPKSRKIPLLNDSTESDPNNSISTSSLEEPSNSPRGPIITRQMYNKWPEAFPELATIDFSKPPPTIRPWVASASEIATLNLQINRKTPVGS